VKSGLQTILPTESSDDDEQRGHRTCLQPVWDVCHDHIDRARARVRDGRFAAHHGAQHIPRCITTPDICPSTASVQPSTLDGGEASIYVPNRKRHLAKSARHAAVMHPAAAPVAEPANANQSRRCSDPSCGCELPANAAFCPQCELRLASWLERRHKNESVRGTEARDRALGNAVVGEPLSPTLAWPTTFAHRRVRDERLCGGANA